MAPQAHHLPCLLLFTKHVRIWIRAGAAGTRGSCLGRHWTLSALDDNSTLFAVKRLTTACSLLTSHHNYQAYNALACAAAVALRGAALAFCHLPIDYAPPPPSPPLPLHAAQTAACAIHLTLRYVAVARCAPAFPHPPPTAFQRQQFLIRAPLLCAMAPFLALPDVTPLS